MKRITLLIVLWLSCVTTLSAQLKPVWGGTFGSSDFYRYFTEEDKRVFFEVLNRFNVDTTKYLVIRDIDEYFSHIKKDTIGGTITSSAYTRNNKKIYASSRSRKKDGAPIGTPVLYIRYWKDPDDDYISFLITTKS